jgi:hypothetical protein
LSVPLPELEIEDIEGLLRKFDEVASTVVNQVGSPDGPNPEVIDPVLLSLIDVTKDGIETPITITIGGIIVLGTLISEKNYVRSLLKSAGTSEEKVNSLISGMREPKKSDSKRDPNFINLRDAYIFVPPNNFIPSVGNQGILWRGKLSLVDSFSLGPITIRIVDQ